jgi:hypothetical protein
MRPRATPIFASGAGIMTLLVTLAFPQSAWSQGAYGGALPTSPGPPPQTKKKKAPKKKADEPETHPAAGGTDTMIPPGSEPALPEDPLSISERVRERIGTDLPEDRVELGRGAETTRHFYGPYYEEYNGRYRFRVAFPLWAERTQPSRTKPEQIDRASLFGGFYYNRRSAERSDDVLFPLFWNMRDLTHGSRTTVIGPLVNRVTPDERDNWLVPFYFTGKRKNGGYTLIPPLLTYSSTDGRGGFNLVGPMFCSYKGGSHCDARTAYDIDFGVAPFYFYGQNEQNKYELIPPLAHYYRYEDAHRSWLNIWGPYYREHTEERELLHLLPIYWSIWGPNERHTTVMPLFHYGFKGKAWLFVNPLFLMKHGDEGENLFVTWGYARYRGRTELDMITPLFWQFRDPDIGLSQTLLFPFLFSRQSPRESSTAFFPFWGHFERFGISETTWITPFFQHTHDLRGWTTNIHPILYLGRDGHSTHMVIAPFFWDFASPESRATVGFPVFWRFADQHEVSQLVGNVYYHEKKLANGLDWEVHIFPALSYGETPDGHWWNLFYGLAGYTRRGATAKMRALWIPITVSSPSPE